MEDEDQEEKKNGQAPDPLIEKFLKTRQIILSGEVCKELAEKIVKQLLILEADSDKPIYVYIDSPGGDVDAGFAIFDTIRFINAPVYTIGMGLVASAGALILLAAPKERRLGFPNSHYLIHQPSSGMKGVATDIEIHAAEIAKTKEKINKIIAEETGTSLDKVSKDTDRDYWLNAEESVSYGLISRVISKRSDLN
ncbi:MAG: ATP-dependent Clp protease proteolytic subunit [Treponema sp.]|nr:ATP-dependent Clp protease proteolytic subunit [Spirochaetia bacterium]MDD7580508.1 ATP-dependent Clp protease proteolytic subunit [Treponema sp.]MCI7441310.1 ATP-dependent Clp protease proteolytic subunit [Spirochaetia bacterium]MDY3757822.1 ATP-dependent Clp protease proteolytic subunit [Treponema sp.]MDY4129865.1 ATP-dependent Clp protease proteolytic subunit [Treponema sp.]